ncbi:MAG: DUF3768 domain-containing protein [Sulfitobacter sp.]
MTSGADDGYFDHLHRIEELEERIRQIRRLNDEARVTGLWCLLIFSSGLHVLGPQALREIRQIVADCKDFDPDNDVYEEHDFGAVDFGGHRIFWKIDYYNKSLSQASTDPANERVTTRVLTIMLAEEY